MTKNKTKINNKVALYIRTSTKEQNQDIQEQRLRDFCKSKGLTVSPENIYRDIGFSGKLSVSERPGLKRLFEDAKNKKFQMVVVYRLDRFFSDLSKLIDAIDKLKDMGIDFAFSTSFPIGIKTPDGTFVIQVLGSLAWHEQQLRVSRMKAHKQKTC